MDVPKLTKFTDVVMPINTSLSEAVDLGGYSLIGVIVPHALEATTAQLSFMASDSLAGTYRTVKVNGTKVTLTIAIDDYATLDDWVDLLHVRYLKILAETAGGVAVSQATAARTFKLITRPV